ncbi:McrB family protein [Heyndrickxia camelliae]|nr:AAA family ATPase [Heyndrickxia camelliae]
MNPLLESKLNELNSAADYECWYLVKQPTAFDNICYLVSFLEDFKAQDNPGNLQDYIANKIETLKTIKPNVDISNNYRALRVAAFFGLITMTNTKYENAVITDSFKEVTLRCNGEYEKTGLYLDIIQRQIEKMYISSSVDEEYEGVRQDYRLYPVMLLYKVLVELGRSTGNYSISMTEYRYLVATTKTFEGFLDTLLLIKLLRDDSDATTSFEQYRSKFDNRLIQALKQLSTLVVERDSISLNEDYIEEVAHKVYIFEDNPNIFTTENYLGFLGSTKSLFELEKFEEEEELTIYENSTRVKGGMNTLLYGVPGSGKSWTIEKEYCDDESRMERLVFHPDYTYSDFIGQILPNVSDGIVSYKFTEGPFTSLLKKAYTNPEKMFYLIIEEINRGNAPAIFGEVFQLLDRKDDGTSEYGITNVDIANIVYNNPNKKVRIPSNMSIIGTMNTSDQNVFTLDTAFQRRWNMRMIENTFVGHDYARTTILDTGVTWQRFCEVINNEIVTKNIRMTSSEDKRLGTYFVRAADLEYHEEADNNDLSEKEQIQARLLNYRFAEKVLKYLWDDAFKFSREDIFKNTIYKSLEEVVNHFNSRSSAKATGNDRLDVFKEEIIDAFLTQDSIDSTVE